MGANRVLCDRRSSTCGARQMMWQTSKHSAAAAMTRTLCRSSDRRMHQTQAAQALERRRLTEVPIRACDDQDSSPRMWRASPPPSAALASLDTLGSPYVDGRPCTRRSRARIRRAGRPSAQPVARSAAGSPHLHRLRRTKPLDAFVPIKARRASYYGRCRSCRSRRARERYHSNAEARAAEIARSLRNKRRRAAERRAA
jgi:hypothetical protein